MRNLSSSGSGFEPGTAAGDALLGLAPAAACAGAAGVTGFKVPGAALAGPGVAALGVAESLAAAWGAGLFF